MNASAPIRVHYYRVHDADYPRNHRIRRYLSSLDDVTVSIARASRHPNRIIRQLRDILQLVRDARRSDLLVLSEMRLTHAGVVRAIGTLTRTPVVIDGFIGLHETRVGDWKELPAYSARARMLRLLDAVAVRAADVYLIDTEVRAEGIRRRFPSASVIALPVGAPSWAAPRPSINASGSLEVLYYGNYIPLHGLDLVVDALSLLPREVPFHLTLIGDGGTRRAVEQRIRAVGIEASCTFLPAVPEQDLADHIAAADVVLGIFGPSEKARTVIANKVWQGLACGRATVTQRSAAIAEIESIAGERLVLTEPGSVQSIADALERCAAGVADDESGASSALHDRLEQYVQSRFDAFGSAVRALAAVRS